MLAVVAASTHVATRPMDSRAQEDPSPRAELRLDAIVARHTDLQGGVGAALPLGNYARFVVIGAVGTRFDASAQELSGRVDLLGRFLLDPFMQSPRGVYGAAGLSALYVGDERWRPLLVALAGIEWSSRAQFVPFLEVGYGGGVRLSVGLRRATTGRR